MDTSRELEEAKCRAAQMEKTMKWWSECTQNWREKWSKVRTERNKAREEAKQLRASLEQSLKESNSYKREKHELELQIQQLKKEMEKIHLCLLKHAGQFNKSGADGELAERDGGETSCSPEMSSDGLKNVNSEDGLVTKTRSFNESDGAENKELEIEEYILQAALPKLNNLKLNVDIDTEEKSLLHQLEKNNLKEDGDEDYTQQKIKMLQIRLDEAQKACNLEREEKLQMHKNMEQLRQEMEEYRDKCEELRAAKQEAIRELLTMQEQHRVELRITNNSLQEEINSREVIERRLSELRTELERLQSENASEWAKRERLETEKINLERENKRLRMQEVQVDRFDRRGRPAMSQSELEMRALQQELIDKNKEITELRHSQSKMKKMLSEANTELSHAVRRAEQYETEVKRLRLRVEELKKELAQAEDELDSATNHVRRLQRTNEELNGQTEGLQVQIQQLSTRHSSPQRHNNFFNHHQKQMNAPTSSLKQLQHSEFKPNINDLKQLFDDSKRLNVDKMQQMQMQHQKHNYYDAKPSFLEHESFLENKTRVDFERAKQKFDSKSQNNNMKIPSVSNKYPNTSIPSSISKQQQNSNLLRKHPNVSGSPQMTKPQVKAENIPSNLINETIQFFDNDSSRMIHKMKKQNDQMDADHCGDSSGNVGNFNLDGLEVSDDEGDVA